jgi:uncharacterized protein with GYD domain
MVPRDGAMGGGNDMTIWVLQGTYTKDGAAGLVANPEDRTKAMAALFEPVGGHILDAYFIVGGRFLVIAEFPDEKAAMATALPALASGALSDVRAEVAIRAADMRTSAELARSIAYRGPGRS